MSSERISTNLDHSYRKASRYDLTAQVHNRQVFHQHLVTNPWQALQFSIGMGLLGAAAAFNSIDVSRWNKHPWQGWILAVIAFSAMGYFIYCAVAGSFGRVDSDLRTQ